MEELRSVLRPLSLSLSLILSLSVPLCSGLLLALGERLWANTLSAGQDEAFLAFVAAFVYLLCLFLVA